MMFYVNREIPLFSREIYFKSQAFARQRTGHPELVDVRKSHVLASRVMRIEEVAMLCLIGEEYT